jgi:uncharacterized membrane protein YeaQ/YmgE (transglycosylase-associated protein family)
MSLVAWFVLGLLTGVIASKLIDHRNPRRVDALLGAVGAVAGGWLFTNFGIADSVVFELYSLLAAAAGAALVVVGYHAVFLANTAEPLETDELPQPLQDAALRRSMPAAAARTARAGHREVSQRFKPE